MKTVVVTGGAKRLGRALVEHYAAKGWRVLFTARYSFEEGVHLAQSLGGEVRCIRSDVSCRTSAGMVRNWIATQTDRIDLLVCNASTFERLRVADTMQSDLDNLLASNLAGPFFMAQQCHAFLKPVKGCVINIADAQVRAGLPEFSVYLAAKAALVSISKSMALEWAPDVRVNAVLPGTMPWPRDTYSASEKQAMEQDIPLAKIGSWSDIVAAVDYLQNASYSTGSCLTVDGGRSSLY